VASLTELLPIIDRHNHTGESHGKLREN
jgi:hypothetical protein